MTALTMHSNGAAKATEMASCSYPTIQTGASLMLSHRPVGRTILVVGTRKLAVSRIRTILEADAFPVVVGSDLSEETQKLGIQDESFAEIRWRAMQNQCEYRPAPTYDTTESWAQLIDDVDGPQKRLYAVCITDTLHAGDQDEQEEGQTETHSAAANARLSPAARARLLVDVCRARRIPINVADRPALCDFSFPAGHRFTTTPMASSSSAFERKDSSSTAQHSIESIKNGGTSALQIAVTTNGKGCRLAGRIRREIVANLPRNVGDAVERVGMMREMAKRRNFSSLQNKLDGKSARDPSLRRKALASKKEQSALAKEAAIDESLAEHVVEDAEEEDLTFDTTPINSPVPQLHSPSGHETITAAEASQDYISAPAAAALQLQQRQDAMMEERKRRMRWVAQMSEYWPIDYLGSLTQTDMEKALETYKEESRISRDVDDDEDDENRRGRDTSSRKSMSAAQINATKRASSQHNLTIRQPGREPYGGQGHIFLVGSGPGHPGLLTAMAHRLLTSTETDVVLSDKLVPSSILALIPKKTTLHIARKFPGNAEGAQSELIALALEAAHQGKRVVRLKQGDPFVYGRGGEEVLAFSKAGFESTIVPGISSALAAPLLLGIPVTQRGAADSMTLCTGVGRGGKSVSLPGYERNRTLVILMGVARLHDVVETLTHGWQSSIQQINAPPSQDVKPAGTRLGAAFPPYTPIAIVERASSSDQRLVASTLDKIERALQRCGEQRPPGMMVIGWATLSLANANDGGNVDVLDDESACAGDAAALERRDRARIARWLGNDNGGAADAQQEYVMREGLDEAYKRELHGSSTVIGSLTAAAVNSDDETRATSLNKGRAKEDEESKIDIVDTSAFALRGPSGWSAPRYGQSGQPRGGWSHGEEETVESTAVAAKILSSVEEA